MKLRWLVAATAIVLVGGISASKLQANHCCKQLVKDTSSFNSRALDDARRWGWKVYLPNEVDKYNHRTASIEDLMRAMQVQSVWPSPYAEGKGCTINVRNHKCMTYVIDGVVVGPTAIVNPEDVYFIAVVQGTESTLRWGSLAPYGAIVVYTKMNGDRKY